MLQHWLDNRTRWSSLGACATIVVDSHRSAGGVPILAMNIDDFPVRIRDQQSQGGGAWLETPHTFVGRNEAGLVVSLVCRGCPAGSAGPLGRQLLDSCVSPSQVGDALRAMKLRCATVTATDREDSDAWQVERNVTVRLPMLDGLLTLAGGHSSARPLPGRGWLIDRLERLNRLPLVSLDDVSTTLRDARLGDSTFCTIVVDPASRQARIESADRTAAAFRKSA